VPHRLTGRQTLPKKMGSADPVHGRRENKTLYVIEREPPHCVAEVTGKASKINYLQLLDFEV